MVNQLFDESEAKRRKKSKHDNLLVNWETRLTADFYGGKWYTLIEGGGFNNVNVAAKNDTDYTMDEIKVKFEVKKRLNNHVCFSREISFYNVAPHSSKSEVVSCECGMRPATLGVTYFKCSELDAELSNHVSFREKF
jgi:hypothetical protein